MMSVTSSVTPVIVWNSWSASSKRTAVMAALQGEMSREELQARLDLQDRKSFRERYLQPALAQGLIEYSRPDKPNSRLQKYRLTELGRALQ